MRPLARNTKTPDKPSSTMATRRRTGSAARGAANTRAGIRYLIQIQEGRSRASVNGRYWGRYQAQLAVSVKALGI